MVALTNEFAGSDGDIFSHTFKLMKLGPLIGKRTWGGVIGIWPRHTLVDGTSPRSRSSPSASTTSAGGVENYGTDPDIEVDNTPQDYAAGEDPQLAARGGRAVEAAGRGTGRDPVRTTPQPARGGDSGRGNNGDASEWPSRPDHTTITQIPRATLQPRTSAPCAASESSAAASADRRPSPSGGPSCGPAAARPCRRGAA